MTLPQDNPGQRQPDISLRKFGNVGAARNDTSRARSVASRMPAPRDGHGKLMLLWLELAIPPSTTVCPAIGAGIVQHAGSAQRATMTGDKPLIGSTLSAGSFAKPN